MSKEYDIGPNIGCVIIIAMILLFLILIDKL